MDKVQFIKAVKKHPCLWDRITKFDHKQKQQKEAWNLVLQEMNPKYDTLTEYERINECSALKDQWHSINSYYKKSLTAKNGRYKYMNSLDFLNYKGRKHLRNKSSNSDKKQNQNDDLDDDNSNEIEILDIKPSVAVMENNNFNQNSYKRTNNNNTSNNNKKYNSSKNNQSNSNCSNGILLSESPLNISSVNNLEMSTICVNAVHQTISREEEEDDQRFLLSFRSVIKDMNKDEKLEFKIEMLQLVKKIKNKRHHNSMSYTGEIVNGEFDAFMMYPKVSLNEGQINNGG